MPLDTTFAPPQFDVGQGIQGLMGQIKEARVTAARRDAMQGLQRGDLQGSIAKLMGVGDVDGAKALVGYYRAMNPPPKWARIGTTDYGQPTYGWVSPGQAFSGQPQPTGTPNQQTGPSPIKSVGDAIISGKQPPTTQGLYRMGPPVRAYLADQGFDEAKAQLEWQAAGKQVQSLSGPQMTRYVGLANSVTRTIGEVQRLSGLMKQGGIAPLNRANLEYLTKVRGNTPQGQLAAQYIAGVNTLKEEFANLAQGGYAPTEPAWKLADQQINGDYGVDELGASLQEVERLINYRLQNVPNLSALGPGSANRYTGQTGAAPAISRPIAEPETTDVSKTPLGATTDPRGVPTPENIEKTRSDDAARIKKLMDAPNGAHATDKGTGRGMTKRNGNWYLDDTGEIYRPNVR